MTWSNVMCTKASRVYTEPDTNQCARESSKTARVCVKISGSVLQPQVQWKKQCHSSITHL